MRKTCPKCAHQRNIDDGEDPNSCSACGVIYAKARPNEAVTNRESSAEEDIREPATFSERLLARIENSKGDDSFSNGLIAAVICIGACIYFFNSGADTSPAANETTKVESLFSSWNGSLPALNARIKQSMNDPKSFEHVSTRWWTNQDHMIVETTFRGTNKFGAVVTNKVRADVDYQGNVLRLRKD